MEMTTAGGGYFQLPIRLFTDPRLSALPAEAKVLYALMLGRLALSCRNDWCDQNGRIFIIFCVREVQSKLNCGKTKAVRLLSALEGAGLITRVKRGLGKSDLIYLPGDEDNLLGSQNGTSGGSKIEPQEVPKPNPIYIDNKQKEKKQKESYPIRTNAPDEESDGELLWQDAIGWDQEASDQESNNELLRQDEIGWDPEDPDVILSQNRYETAAHAKPSPAWDGMLPRRSKTPPEWDSDWALTSLEEDETAPGEAKPSQALDGEWAQTPPAGEETAPCAAPTRKGDGAAPRTEMPRELTEENIREETLSLLKANWDYGWLQGLYPYNQETINEWLELSADVLTSRRKTIRVAGEDRPAREVKERFLMLNEEHIGYLLNTMATNRSQVRNIKQYLITALYNAPITCANYYEAAVRRDSG